MSASAARPPATGAAYPQRGFRRPSGSTDVLLIRHGQSAALGVDGEDPVCDGHADPALSADGLEQAELLAARLDGVGIDAIHVSDLRRTAQTAAPLVARLGIVPVVDADLREIHLGEWEGGIYRRMVADGHPAVRRLMTEGRWSLAPGAEPDAAFGARVRAALERVRLANGDRRVAVICHAGVIGQALAVATGASPTAFMHADNASVSQVILQADLWLVRRFNDTAHLGGAFTAPGT